MVHAPPSELALSSSFAFPVPGKCEGQTVEWWSAAWQEVRAIADALMLAFLDVGSPLASLAFTTDAMGANAHAAKGYSVVWGRGEYRNIA